MTSARLDPISFRSVRRAAHGAERKGGFEVCGAIIRATDGLLCLRPLRNLATEPAKWEIDREWLREIRRDLKDSGSRLVGTYHSHVGGYAYPSPKDLDYYPSGFLMMIYDTQERRVGLWRPLIRKEKGRLKPIAVICESPSWNEEDAFSYAQYLKGKFRNREKRNKPNK
jgi:proteasome lid subunit RPN8/RPN11